MKTKITVEKIHCRDDSYEWGKDEIYFAVFPQLVRRKSKKKGEVREVCGALSRIESGVERGSIFQPVFLDGTSAFEVDAGDADAMSLVFFLYEADNEAQYKRLKKSLKMESAGVPKTDWSPLADLPSDVASIPGWISYAYKALVVIVKAMCKDDLVGRQPAVVELDKDASFGPRELTFKGCGATYRLAFRVDKVS